MDRVARAKYCLDAYALFEIARGSPHYADISHEFAVIPDLALVEFWDVLSRREGKEIADESFAFFELDAVPVPAEVLRTAIILRRERKDLDLSLTDAAGYCLARHLGISFVTGDESFRNLPGVTFRKKM